MVVPDLALICEIMLMAEGFQMSKILSRKFVILYKLCEDLLSKSRHYDWKLRAIKTTLYVAGGMKRAAPELSEDKVGDRRGGVAGGMFWEAAREGECGQPVRRQGAAKKAGEKERQSATKCAPVFRNEDILFTNKPPYSLPPPPSPLPR